MTEKLQILSQYFGYSSFREGQDTLIDAVLNGRDTLGVMPTGAGKSLCFQVPALMKPGVTLVVSPLISLMKDQVSALVQNGIRGAFLNSSLTPRQYQAALRNARQGVYKIIYVAPERLMTEEFLSFAQSAEISMVTVDEAHCVSQWGQDFRPGYLMIPQFLRQLPRRPVVSAFTATATPRVREDIVRLLELKDPFVLVSGFDRKNLYFEVRKPKDKIGDVLRLLEEHKDKSGILYCATRKNVEDLCETLRGRGYAASRYHAGLSDQERRDNQDDFLYDRCSVMVATNAFGMGIDKSNVSFVIHFNMPKDLESYYQEAGRAGRDGSPAACYLLYSGQDVVLNQFLSSHAGEDETIDDETRAVIQEQARQRLKAMTFYCHTTDCLRAYMLSYFGETAPRYCGNCGNCLHHFEELDVAEPARKILACIKSTGQRYGTKLITDTLRGGKTERVRQLGLDRRSCHGTLSELSENRVRDIIRFLTQTDLLSVSDGQYPVLELGPGAEAFLSDGGPLLMKLPKEREEPVRRARKSAGEQPSGQRPALFEKLRKLRAELAAEQKVPSYVVFSNAALEDMCAKLPTTAREFLEVSGVGKAKLERYGELFLQVIRADVEENGVDSP